MVDVATGLADESEPRQAPNDGGGQGRALLDQHDRIRVGETFDEVVLALHGVPEDHDVVAGEVAEARRMPEGVPVIVQHHDPHAGSSRSVPVGSGRGHHCGSGRLIVQREAATPMAQAATA